MRIVGQNQIDSAELKQNFKDGKIIAFPTDTVYGLGCDAFNPAAIEKLYNLKGRDFDKPLAVILAGVEQIPFYAKDISEKAWKIIRKYLPGALTVVLANAGKILPQQATLGIRILNSPLFKKFNLPITATSANKSGQNDPVTAQAVVQNLGAEVDLVIEGGRCEIGKPSTVIDLTQEPFKILRQGSLKVNL